MGEVERLPGSRYTPIVALHRCLQRVGEMKALVIVEQDLAGRWWVTRTAMSNADACTAAVVLMDDAMQCMNGKHAPEPAPDMPGESA